MTELDPQTIHLVAGDETVLKYLGAAAVLQWHNIPPDAQQTLLRQASAIGGGCRWPAICSVKSKR